jgi:DNA-binding FadR family transcriptional regulator
MAEPLRAPDGDDSEHWVQPRLRDRVTERLAREIVAGHIAPGDAFPSSEEVIRRYGVSRTVARETVQTLSMVGMLRAQQGKRTTVLDPAEWDLLSPIVLEAYRQEGRASEIVRHLGELRAVIEPETAAWVASRGSDEDVEELQRTARVMMDLAKSDASRDAFLAADRDFHDHVARASGNPLVAALRRDIASVLAMGFALSQLTAEDTLAAAQQHVAIAEAIAARDADTARSAMAQHVQWAASVDQRDAQALEAAHHGSPNRN